MTSYLDYQRKLAQLEREQQKELQLILLVTVVLTLVLICMVYAFYVTYTNMQYSPLGEYASEFTKLWIVQKILGLTGIVLK